GVSSVSIDDVEGGRRATQHLINLGHERIGIISGRPLPSPFTPERDRYRGYLEALEQAGIRPDLDLVTNGFFTVEGGEDAIAALLAQPRPPTAVFAISDEMAFGALTALRRHGLSAPQDISVVGFDGHDMSELLGLTTVEQPVAEIGARAARALLD